MAKGLRKCKDCGLEAYTEEDLMDFKLHKGAKFGRLNRCKACHNKQYKQYCINNPEKKKETSRKYQTKIGYRGYDRSKHLLSTYGVTEEWFNRKMIEQDGRCKICGNTVEESGRTLCVDHCHTSLNNRGLLCYNCNLMIGHAKDNIHILEQAIEYIKDSK